MEFDAAWRNAHVRMTRGISKSAERMTYNHATNF